MVWSGPTVTIVGGHDLADRQLIDHLLGLGHPVQRSLLFTLLCHHLLPLGHSPEALHV